MNCSVYPKNEKSMHIVGKEELTSLCEQPLYFVRYDLQKTPNSESAISIYTAARQLLMLPKSVIQPRAAGGMFQYILRYDFQEYKKTSFRSLIS